MGGFVGGVSGTVGLDTIHTRWCPRRCNGLCQICGSRERQNHKRQIDREEMHNKKYVSTWNTNGIQRDRPKSTWTAGCCVGFAVSTWGSLRGRLNPEAPPATVEAVPLAWGVEGMAPSSAAAAADGGASALLFTLASMPPVAGAACCHDGGYHSLQPINHNENPSTVALDAYPRRSALRSSTALAH